MYNILVIDDEEPIRTTFTMALERFGFDVSTASDGLEGIEKFDEYNFDLVITDISMPVLDGIGVVRHIRNSEKQNTPVIGVSGIPDLLKEGDFNATFQKPASLKALIDTVKNITAPN